MLFISFTGSADVLAMATFNKNLQTTDGLCSNRPGDKQSQTSSDVGYLVNNKRLSVPISNLFPSKFASHVSYHKTLICIACFAYILINCIVNFRVFCKSSIC